MKSFVHTNYPIQVCSLTTGSSGSWSFVCRSVVTKSRDGKAVNSGLSGNRRSEAKQQVVGKRTTVGIVKVTRRVLLSETGLGRVECSFNARRPLLSNIYLNEIDKEWHDNSSVKLVRFADDMVFLCKSKAQAEFGLRKLKGQLEELKLTLNDDKTKIRHVNESFDFVGFTYRDAYSGKHKRMVVIKYPRAKSIKKIFGKIKEMLKRIPNGTALREVIKEVNPKLRRWSEYFKIGNSYQEALKLSQYSCEQLRIYWRRHKSSKNTRSYKKWSDKYFYQGGLLYVPYLIKA
ncbi:MAG: hypothetical protein A2020_08805 [Lentisphaerae bacterium GWF2_45_14]|nr:MAG: hypothetical protein A2020_08805 [Lentisphaerae bacterium GWF2_45_14]